MLDGFLKVGAGFDWITPLWAFVQDARYGQPFQINVPYEAGWSGREITTELNEKGIRSWGLMVVGETITFTVRKPQARYALYWLERWGVPYMARVDKLPAGRSRNAYGQDFEDEDADEEGYQRAMYAELDEEDDEIEDEVEEAKPYRRGLVDYSIRKINTTADRLLGGR